MKRILIFANYVGDRAEYYAEAVTKAGFDYEISDSTENLDRFDGLLLSGGPDLDPEWYGEENTASLGIDRDYDRRGFDALKYFYEAGKPVLGICRGFQVINVFFGGSLHQDIPDHNLKPEERHKVIFTEENFLADVYPPEILVNSFHHQAAKVPGKGLRVFAYAEDGTIEAAVHKDGRVFGVQWHPERMTGDTNPAASGKGVFEAFKNLF